MSTALHNPIDGDESVTLAVGAQPRNMAADFEARWRAVRQQVWMWCRRAAGNEDDAQDLFQGVAVRAWRGYPTFRGEASFLTWTLAIARRLAAYQLGQRSAKHRQESSLEFLQGNSPAVLPTTDAPTPVVTTLRGLPEAVQAAHASEELTSNETSVLLLRLQMPDAGWARIGSLLNLSETACAVLHCRAIPKLRVFLFLEHPDMIGGADAIAQAYLLAKEAREDSLSADEAQAFRRLILEKDTGYRKSGWRSALRAACEKVIRRMGVML